MKNKLRISATQLEKWRRFRELESYTEEQLCNDLFGEFIPTIKMEIGTAFHALMEKIKEEGVIVRYEELPDDGFIGTITEMNSWKFDYRSILQIADHVENNALKEKKAIKCVELDNHSIQLVAQPDAIYGLTAVDYKTRWRQFTTADDILLYYINSVQWKTYLYVYSLNCFKYVIINLTKTQHNDIISIESITPFSLYAYSGMVSEVLDLLEDFANWIVFRGYENHFQQKINADIEL